MIALTGSNGKTTVKEMLRAILTFTCWQRRTPFSPPKRT
ncbi:MAG: hypothetical protein HC782_03085 [Gammaproteobacteria bacterium]|nr:hypothetical protein [Gammaproteobacteria bacterium]